MSEEEDILKLLAKIMKGRDHAAFSFDPESGKVERLREDDPDNLREDVLNLINAAIEKGGKTQEHQLAVRLIEQRIREELDKLLITYNNDLKAVGQHIADAAFKAGGSLRDNIGLLMVLGERLENTDEDKAAGDDNVGGYRSVVNAVANKLILLWKVFSSFKRTVEAHGLPGKLVSMKEKEEFESMFKLPPSQGNA